MEQTENNNRLFYYYIGNEKHGAVTAEELRQLVLEGIIDLNTQIETSDGRKLQAKSIKNLFDVQVLIKRIDNLSDRIVTLEQKIDQLISSVAYKSLSKKASKNSKKNSNTEEENPEDVISESSSSTDTSEEPEIQKTKILKIGKWYVGTHISPGRYRVQIVSDNCFIGQRDSEENCIFSVALNKDDKYNRSCEIELEEKDIINIEGAARFVYLSEVIQKRKRD